MAGSVEASLSPRVTATPRSSRAVPAEQLHRLDPKQKLALAEQRATRKARVTYPDYKLSSFNVEELVVDGWSKSPAPGEAPTADGKSSSVAFKSVMSRFTQGPTERDGTAAHVGPGSYDDVHGTMSSTISDKARTPPFAYGWSSPREEASVTAAQMAYEVKGEQFLQDIEKHPDGWLRSDYHRWILAAANRTEYKFHRKQVELARQLKKDDDRAYRENAARIVATQMATRQNAANEVKALRECRAQAGRLDKRDSGCRSRLVKARTEAWQEYAATCVEEAKQLHESARRAKSLEEMKRARIASEMRTFQKQQELEKREEDNRRLEEVRAARETSKSGGGRSLDWRAADIRHSAAFKALTPEQKVAVDEANAETAAARKRANERAKLARKREKEAQEARTPGRVSKNLTELVKESAIRRAAELKELARLDAEQKAERAAAAAALQVAEEAAAADAMRKAEEAAAAAIAMASEAAEMARKTQEKRERAAAKQKQAAPKVGGKAAVELQLPPPAPPPPALPLSCHQRCRPDGSGLSSR